MATQIFDKYFHMLHTPSSFESASGKTAAVAEDANDRLQPGTPLHKEADVAALVSLGFELPAVVTALDAARGEKEVAANILLG